VRSWNTLGVTSSSYSGFGWDDDRVAKLVSRVPVKLAWADLREIRNHEGLMTGVCRGVVYHVCSEVVEIDISARTMMIYLTVQ